MTEPLPAAADVSVVVPCYRSTSVREAVESVVAQSVRPREVILVDDCSGDATLETLNHIAETWGRDWIAVVSLKANVGAGEARNAGWARATSTFVAFLDADDCWHPRKIELQYGWMSQNPQASICGHRWQLERFPHGVDQHSERPPRARKVSAANFLFSNIFATSSVMLRRDLPMRFPPGKRFGEDYELWLRVVLEKHEAWLIDLSLVHLSKAAYGASGLSARLWSMECGELGALGGLRRDGLLSWGAYVTTAVWSLTKFVRRVAVMAVRRFS